MVDDMTVTPAGALSAVLGLGAGLGLFLLVVGWRGTELVRSDRLRQWLPLCRPVDRRQLMRIGLVTAVGLLVGLATGWIVGALLAGAACWGLPRVLARDPEHARRVVRIEAIASWAEMLRDTLSAAAGLEQAILATAPLAPAAVRREVGALAAAIENGRRLAPSLRLLADELADPTGDLVIAALVLAAEQQARQLGDLLGSLAHTAREQASMRLRVEAGRARTRTSVRVIVGATVGFAVVVVLLNRQYLMAYDSAFGQVVLLAVGALFSVGFAWLVRIAAVTAPARFLTAERFSSGREGMP